MKRESPENVIGAIREVSQGGVYLSGRMAKKMLFQCTGRTQDESAVDALKDREFEVFKLIGKGFSTPEIAFQLHISPNTVESYRVEIKKKLKLTQSRELVRYAIEWNYKN